MKNYERFDYARRSSNATIPKSQKVWALKISVIEFDKDGSAKIAPQEEGYASFKTKPGFDDRFQGAENDLGYFVVYEDGYQSWSPTAAFEKGYTRLF